MWAAQDLPAPFTGNLTSPPAVVTASGARYRSYCGLESDRAKLEAMPETLDYGMACRMVSALIARAVLQGRPLEQVLERFSSLPERQSFTQVSNALTGTVRPPNEVVGEWLLSWYADELPGTSPAIQDPMWNLRRFFPASTLVDARVSIGGGESLLQLAELDARYIEITTAGPTRLGYTARDGSSLPTGRSDLAILRVR